MASRAVLSIAGGDAFTFLQGLVTQDVALANVSPAYSFLLAPNGRVLFDFYIHAYEGAWALDVEKTIAPALLAKLTLYKLHKDVTLQEAPAWAVYATGLLRTIGPKEHGAPDISKTYRQLSLEHGMFDGVLDYAFGSDVVADISSLHQNAVSFTKGCYMGQELTSRMHLKDQGKKQLVALRCTRADQTALEALGHLRCFTPPYATLVVERDKLPALGFERIGC